MILSELHIYRRKTTKAIHTIKLMLLKEFILEAELNSWSRLELIEACLCWNDRNGV
jgi:hypothetical protein